MDQERCLVAGDSALLTDLYELTMLQAYVLEGMMDTAVFDLFVRRLPPNRNYLVACGLQDVLGYLTALRFSRDSLDYLDSLGKFRPAFLDYLAAFRFTGEVRAVGEGTVVFPNEPILEVSAPLPEAQLIETYLLNQIHYQTLVASKAARVVTAAEGRAVVDFGLRRYHGLDAGPSPRANGRGPRGGPGRLARACRERPGGIRRGGGRAVRGVGPDPDRERGRARPP